MSDLQPTLVAGGMHRSTFIFSNRHEQNTATSRLQALLGAVALKSGKFIGQAGPKFRAKKVDPDYLMP